MGPRFHFMHVWQKIKTNGFFKNFNYNTIVAGITNRHGEYKPLEWFLRISV